MKKRDSSTEEKDLAKAYEKNKRSFVNEKAKDICKCISELLNLKQYPEKKWNDFDKWHENTCCTIINTSVAKEAPGETGYLFKYEKEPFSYGQAQKWLNMTLKNMLTMGLWKELADIKQDLHVPVDSYIIEAAGSEKKYTAKSPIFLRTKEKIKNNSSWSAWDKQDYDKFQIAIRNELTKEKLKELKKEFSREIKHPIDWEHYAWLEIAKRRRGN